MYGSEPTPIQPTPILLAEAPLPLRVRQILESVLALLTQVLTPQLNLTAVELERLLFKRADTARNSQHQSELMAELRRLRECKQALAPAMLAGIEAALAALRGQREASLRRDIADSDAKTLTLVTSADIDRDIVLREIARRETYRGRSALQLLGHRFAVLAASPVPDDDDIPLGPYSLCRILSEAGASLPLGLETQLLLFRAFEQQVMSHYLDLAERLNTHLAQEGVLPGLVYTPYRSRPAGQSRLRSGSDDVPASPSAALRNSHAPMTRWHGQSSASSWSAMLNEAIGPAAPEASGGGGSGFAGTGGPSAGMPANAGQAGDEPAAMTELRTLLGHRPHGGGAAMPGSPTSASVGAGGSPGSGSQAVPASAAGSGLALPTTEVLDTLASLQVAPQDIASGKSSPSLLDIRRALLRRTREKHGENATLSPQDGDTFDLLGMLYNEIQREVRPDAPAGELLSRLQIPVVRAALQDRAFFVREQHPARELLNSVAESGATWLADDEADPQLLSRLRQAVDRVATAYDGNDSIFEEANRDIQNQYRALVRKAETTERRHVEAARGKDRLDSAKQHAAGLIRASLAKRNPPKFVRALIEQAWSDVLTLTLLRQGTQSEEWKDRVQATQRIAELAGADVATPDPALAGKVESALVQIGYHQDEAGAIARHLAHTQGEEASPSRTELTAKLKARMRPGDAAGEARKPDLLPRTPAEETCYAQLRTLPFGTWFEFTRNQQGDVRRQRLSWFSLTTDNALFVNQRGQKVGEQTLDSLARLMAQGQVRIVTEDQGRLIDRAWQATVKALRSFTGIGAGAPQEPRG